MNANFKAIDLLCRCDICEGNAAQKCVMLRGPHGSVRICVRHIEAMAWGVIRRMGERREKKRIA